MAGSYNHIVTDTGDFLDTEDFTDMIENLGDAYEMAEEMYGMIWDLVRHRDDPRAAVEDARQNYERGLRFAAEVNRP